MQQRARPVPSRGVVSTAALLVALTGVLGLACASPPGDARPLKSQALHAAAHGRLEEALRDLRLAIRFAPEDAEAHFLLGALLLRHERPVGAATALERAVEIDPRDPRSLTAYGLVLKILGSYDDARAALLHSLTLRPDDAPTLAALAEVHRLDGQPRKCAARYRDMLALLEAQDSRSRRAEIALDAARQRALACEVDERRGA